MIDESEPRPDSPDNVDPAQTSPSSSPSTDSSGGHGPAVSFPGYTILHLIGEGGMGSVYLCRDDKLDRLVAIKTISRDVHTDERARARFVREARTMATVEHRHAVRVHSFEEFRGQDYLVMEYVEGEPLARRIWREGQLAIDDAIGLTTQCSEALQAAWKEGIIHRDVKPSNILLDRRGQARMADFGLAKATVGGDDITLSDGGGLLCTPFYASPQQLRGDADLDFRTDIYSLGIVLYEMLTGERPFKGSSAFAVALRCVRDPMPDPRLIRPEIPYPVVSLIRWMAAKTVAGRPDSYEALLTMLENLRQDPTRSIAKLVGVATESPTGEVEPVEEYGRFVGREALLGTLTSLLDRSAATRGTTVFVTGEAGTGKTWLIREFARRAEMGHENLIALVVGCKAVPGTAGALAPFRELLDLLVYRRGGEDSPAFVSDKTAERVRYGAPDAIRALVGRAPELIGSLIPATDLLEASQAVQELQPAVAIRLRQIRGELASRSVAPDDPLELLIERYISWIRQIASHRPVLVVIDDLQWVDRASAAMLHALGRALRWPGLLLVGCYRPSEVVVGRLGERHPLDVVVNELGAVGGEPPIDLDVAADRAFLDELVDAGPNELGESFRRKLYARTAGQALFTAELLGSLRQRGMLMKGPDGKWREGPDVDWGSLPRRIQAVVLERLGRLDRPIRRLLEVASVCGTEFEAEVLARVVGVEIQEAVQALSEDAVRRHRLVSSISSPRPGGRRVSRYRFVHVLFRDGLYDGLSEGQRVYLHEDVGRALEDVFVDDVDEFCPVLAHHYLEAQVVEKALEYSYRAGQQAVRLRAEPDAIDHYQAALACLSDLPASLERDGRELAITLEATGANVAVRGPTDPEVGRMFARAKELAERFGDSPELSDAWCLLGIYYTCLPRLAEGLDAGQRAVDGALRLGDPGRVFGHRLTLGFALFYAGRFTECRDLLLTALREYDPDRDGPAYSPMVDPLPMCHAWLGHSFRMLGRFSESVREHELSLELAEQGGHALSIAYCRLHWLMTQVEYGQWRAAEQNLELLSAICRERHLKFFSPVCEFARGRLQFERGQLDEGIASMKVLLAVGAGGTSRGNMSYPMRELAESLGRAGRVEAGLELIQEARSFASESGERCMEPEYGRVEGDLLRRRPDVDSEQIEQTYTDALDLARIREDRLCELRVALSLADFWRESDREPDARSLVAQAMAKVDTSLPTRDLERARVFIGGQE